MTVSESHPISTYFELRDLFTLNLSTYVSFGTTSILIPIISRVLYYYITSLGSAAKVIQIAQGSLEIHVIGNVLSCLIVLSSLIMNSGLIDPVVLLLLGFPALYIISPALIMNKMLRTQGVGSILGKLALYGLVFVGWICFMVLDILSTINSWYEIEQGPAYSANDYFFPILFGLMSLAIKISGWLMQSLVISALASGEAQFFGIVITALSYCVIVEPQFLIIQELL
ncbi:hypothetical protein FGO68_gene3911 [Halteria grandinella]|uniref:Uncharacterized protein n=1 Tax=Halteria grandinella TaxID=5974 RepID=A0A8J8NIJ2_HALGN|nr:hypothetical protein FGO68_gene3911 [Halteria grandinella]